MRYLFATLLCLVVAACSSPFKSERYAAIDTSAREFVLLTATPWDSDFRSAMFRQKFKVLKFASQKTVIRENRADEQTEIYSKAGARYAISLSCHEIDRTIISAKYKVDLACEVTDIRSNEVVLSIKKRGWTPAILEELAQEFAAQWH